MTISASATMTASVGWITRRRSSTCDVGDRSCCSACASEVAGNSVSPSAATAPLTLTTSTPSASRPTIAARPPRRSRDIPTGPSSSQRAVSVIAPSSRKVLARCTAMNSARARLALSATSCEQHQAGADAGFGEHEEHRPAGGAAGRMPGRARSPDGHDQRQQREQGEPAREAVGELDDRRDRRRPRHDLAVAERPVLAAAGAGAGRPHVGPPADHREVPGDDDPREPGEAVHGVLRIV